MAMTYSWLSTKCWKRFKSCDLGTKWFISSVFAMAGMDWHYVRGVGTSVGRWTAYITSLQPEHNKSLRTLTFHLGRLHHQTRKIHPGPPEDYWSRGDWDCLRAGENTTLQIWHIHRSITDVITHVCLSLPLIPRSLEWCLLAAYIEV